MERDARPLAQRLAEFRRFRGPPASTDPRAIARRLKARPPLALKISALERKKTAPRRNRGAAGIGAGVPA